jgi:TonB family protein
MSRRLTLFALGAIFSSAWSLANAQVIVISSAAKALAVYAPPPQYPLAARMANVTGRGIAILDVNRATGLVLSARMAPSTGDKDLDQAALKAVRQWRFRLGGASRIDVPIQFTINRPTTHPASNELHQAVYAPQPVYPAEARSRRLTGMGVVLVDVNRNSGHVTAARMLQSTGDRALDDAALTAFRQWRFRPGTVSQVRIPIKFLMRGIVPVVYE